MAPIPDTRAQHDRLDEILTGFELPVVAGFESQTMGLAATLTASRRSGS